MSAVTLFARPRAGLRVCGAGPRDAKRVLDYLDRRPAENVFLSHMARRDGLAPHPLARVWHLAERDGEVAGVCVAASNVVPAADDHEVAGALGEALRPIRPGTQSIVGERGVVEALWQRVCRRAPRVRLRRQEQPYYVLERGDVAAPFDDGRLRLRLATSADLDLVVRASADMLREEILDDPNERDPAGFRTQVTRMVREGAIFVGECGSEVVFKAHVNVRTPLAAQVSGVYTLPEHRRRGYARAGMQALAARLLPEVPVLCLYVNRENVAAVRAYEAAGFRRVASFQSIFLESR